jgi:glutamine synthetase
MKTIIYEYVWIGGNNELRSKIKIQKISDKDIEDLPIVWNYDGSSTNQATTEKSEVLIKPVKMYNNPFFKDKKYLSKLVLCETMTPDMKPHDSNSRHDAIRVFKKYKKHDPWFGIEQEYFIRELNKTRNILGFNTTHDKKPKKQGQYYCSVGLENNLGRDLAEKHIDYCLYAGVNICGINAEVALGQWEYQIGICKGIEMGDDLWMSRYILNKLAEDFGYIIDYHPKPMDKWNGSGCHTNFSTKYMREGSKNKTGLKHIKNAILRLSKEHEKHMVNYGSFNDMRMTGIHETSSYTEFSSGKADRSCSVRIGNETQKNQCGYFEDRRPSSNCDPYLVTQLLVETCLS